ncbi:MAG: hypothetical protein EPN97_03335 [Alphaproteobacteria bacterium]|nr:MAG: hypothetical protein EPN97_03335 [Alphaproteobacteria bacterium]
MIIHINRPSSTRFIARVRSVGCRKYKLLGKPTKSYEAAVVRMARTFAKFHHYKRGDVLIVADYYEPQQLVEIKR